MYLLVHLCCRANGKLLLLGNGTKCKYSGLPFAQDPSLPPPYVFPFPFLNKLSSGNLVALKSKEGGRGEGALLRVQSLASSSIPRSLTSHGAITDSVCGFPRTDALQSDGGRATSIVSKYHVSVSMLVNMKL